MYMTLTIEDVVNVAINVFVLIEAAGKPCGIMDKQDVRIYNLVVRNKNKEYHKARKVYKIPKTEIGVINMCPRNKQTVNKPGTFTC